MRRAVTSQTEHLRQSEDERDPRHDYPVIPPQLESHRSFASSVHSQERNPTAMRLNLSEERLQVALDEVMNLEPTWKLPPGARSTLANPAQPEYAGVERRKASVFSYSFIYPNRYN